MIVLYYIYVFQLVLCQKIKHFVKLKVTESISESIRNIVQWIISYRGKTSAKKTLIERLFMLFNSNFILYRLPFFEHGKRSLLAGKGMNRKMFVNVSTYVITRKISGAT